MNVAGKRHTDPSIVANTGTHTHTSVDTDNASLLCVCKRERANRMSNLLDGAHVCPQAHRYHSASFWEHMLPDEALFWEQNTLPGPLPPTVSFHQQVNPVWLQGSIEQLSNSAITIYAILKGCCSMQLLAENAPNKVVVSSTVVGGYGV